MQDGHGHSGAVLHPSGVRGVPRRREWAGTAAKDEAKDRDTGEGFVPHRDKTSALGPRRGTGAVNFRGAAKEEKPPSPQDRPPVRRQLDLALEVPSR